jgi:hypothetical protein
MTRNQAIEIAIARHNDRCHAFWQFWMDRGQEPKDEDFGFHHGWFQVGGFNIGGHEYAPGPTYNQD